MAIKSIANASSSLGLGLVYDVSYDYDPREGVKVTMHFVNEQGFYPAGNVVSTSQKASVTVAGTTFNLYPIRYEVSEGATQKVARVDFVDDTFKLNNYYVTLVDRGCGKDIFALGQPVDKRSSIQKQNDTTDQETLRIKEFTQFPDLEYSFNDFLNVLRQKFFISIQGFFDFTITQSFTGTFRDVLDSWCSFYNLAYFFDNGIITICSPASLQIFLPSRPADAISYSYSESAENTYNTTACYYYNQQGGEIPVSPQNLDGEEGDLNSLLIQSVAVRPVGSEFGSIQQTVDPNQVVAAQFGAEFWFLYNYIKGTATEECGWERTYLSDINNGTQIFQSITALLRENPTVKKGGIAFIDEVKFAEKFEFYLNYGRKIAGKYYYSDRLSSASYNQGFYWYDNENQSYFKITDATPNINDRVNILSSPGISLIEGTQINRYFEGLKHDGNRLLYVDDIGVDFDTEFALTDTEKEQLNNFYTLLTEGFFGSKFMDYSEITSASKYIIFPEIQISDITSVLDLDSKISNKTNLLKPRYSVFNMKGVKPDDIAQSEEPELEISTSLINNVNGNLNEGNQSQVVLGTNGTLQIKKSSDFRMYYGKYSRCENAHTDSQGCYTRNFVINEVSTDVPVIFSATMQSKFGYTLTRDLTYLNQYFNGQLLNTLAQSWSEKEKTVSFTLNHYYSVGASFLRNGLVSMNLAIAGDGVRCTYTFSNAILRVPPNPSILHKIHEGIRSSTIRKYNPEEILST